MRVGHQQVQIEGPSILYCEEDDGEGEEGDRGMQWRTCAHNSKHGFNGLSWVRCTSIGGGSASENGDGDTSRWVKMKDEVESP